MYKKHTMRGFEIKLSNHLREKKFSYGLSFKITVLDILPSYQIF